MDEEKKRQLVIIGDGEFAEIAYEYFTYDSEYKVVAFAVEKAYQKKSKLFELPIIAYEELTQYYPSKEYDVFVAITYTKLNRIRRRLYQSCKEKGYTCATYVSSKAFVWHNVKIGENSFIFENNTIQYHVEIGNNVILWSGNHIGHRSKIGDDCWLTSQDVISGYCEIGRGSFIGVNATLGDHVRLEEDTVFGAGAVAVKSIEGKGCVYVGSPAKAIQRTAYEQFQVGEDEI